MLLRYALEILVVVVEVMSLKYAMTVLACVRADMSVF